MYYVIHWNGLLNIYDSTTKSLSYWAGSSVLEAIELFNQNHWNTDKEPGRFTLTDKALLDYQTGTNQFSVHAIIYSIPSISLTYLKQQFHEEFI